MLEKVGFKNFLALRDVEIDLEPFTVIVGPNSSGKSTILEGINRICAIPNDNNAPLNRLTNEGSIVFDPKFFTSKVGTETEISFTFQDAFDENESGLSNHQQVFKSFRRIPGSNSLLDLGY